MNNWFTSDEHLDASELVTYNDGGPNGIRKEENAFAGYRVRHTTTLKQHVQNETEKYTATNSSYCTLPGVFGVCVCVCVCVRSVCVKVAFRSAKLCKSRFQPS
jgi:hypothetical protein